MNYTFITAVLAMLMFFLQMTVFDIFDARNLGFFIFGLVITLMVSLLESEKLRRGK